MEIQGKIIKVLPLQTGVSQKSNNAWAKQSYVLETVEQYPKHCAFDVFGTERIQNMAILEGEMLSVSFNIDAHEYNGRWFNNITAYRIDRLAQPATQAPVTQVPVGAIVPPPPTVQQTAQQAAAPQTADDNLPF